jgi:hypothetical protein
MFRATFCPSSGALLNTSTLASIRELEAATAVQKCSWWLAKCCPKHVEQRLDNKRFYNWVSIWLVILFEDLKMHETTNNLDVSFICWFWISRVLFCILWSLQRWRVSLNYDKNNGYIYMKTHVNLQYLAESFWEWNTSDGSCRENQNIHFTFSNFFFFFKLCTLWDNVTNKVGTDKPQKRLDLHVE